jgi:antirestriction protein ArdC
MANSYQKVTDQIIDLIEEGGELPWNKPWKGSAAHQNPVSGTRYSGMNILTLETAKQVHGFESNRWVTYKQAQDKGGHVKSGEKSTVIYFWKVLFKDTEEDEWISSGENEGLKKRLSKSDYKSRVNVIPTVKHFNVFNLDQTADLDDLRADETEDGEEWDPIERAEQIVQDYEDGPSITEGASKAFYRPSDDEVHVPDRKRFPSAGNFYHTLFHELAHSTGHESRLDRKHLKRSAFGSEDYSKEELTAELASSFLSADAGIDYDIANNAAYIQSWLEALRNDNRMIVHAASRARKAVEHITG